MPPATATEGVITPTKPKFQMTLFSYEEEEEKNDGPKWLQRWRDIEWIVREDAEALIEDLGKMPSGKGSWLRCLEIDHDKVYNSHLKNWDAEIWQHNGIGIHKYVNSKGEVKDIVNPHPFEWYYWNGKQVKPFIHEEVEKAWIEEENSTFFIKTRSGEYMAELEYDSRIDRCNWQPYDPTCNLEHFAIECYKHKIPRELMTWRSCHASTTKYMGYWSRNIGEDEAKKIDPMGKIPNGWKKNDVAENILKCAEIIGITMKMDQNVPALVNLGMYPNEKNCMTCLRRRSKGAYFEAHCPKEMNRWTCYSNYLWDRVTPAKPLSKSKKKKETEIEEDFDDYDYEDYEDCECNETGDHEDNKE